MNTKQKQSGVTLMELMVVVAIAAILAAIAFPSFSEFINTSRQTSALTQLMSDLNRARGEAIKRNQRVLVCSRDAAATDCDTVSPTDWQNGWLVCYDANSDNSCDVDISGSNPNPITSHPALPSNLTLTANLVRFNPSGSAAAGLTLTLLLNGASSKTVNVAATGTISKL